LATGRPGKGDVQDWVKMKGIRAEGRRDNNGFISGCFG